MIRNNTTSVLDTPQKTETKSGRRSSQFSDRHIWKIITHTQLRAVSRDLFLDTQVGTPNIHCGQTRRDYNKAKRRQNTNPIYFRLYIYFFEKIVKSAAARLESHFHEFAFFFFLQSHLHVRPPATFAVKVLQLEHLVSDHLL